MPAYMIIVAELEDPDGFREYAQAAGNLIGKFGGEYIVRGARRSVCLEGDWPDEQKIVISKWPSLEAAQAFWNSREYGEIRKLREGRARVRVRLVEGAGS
ncbi:DUF1330 domain-containing protein [Luteithermobacter gelatinilyticus]|uniref:DUF1330 domain-containing protein n=1 Tax=Luteithermobacter gelatinilyticus TaxID=2582913 RepID=UPI0011065274|nr:DUF1330 domain-containing protein [Luteithermobacter gelatinilyticus]